jgi:hypothetical protein
VPEWLDSDSLITPSRGPYRFTTLPTFWDYLEQKANEQVLASSEFVLIELTGNGDKLEAWARHQQGTLFRSPTQDVQNAYSQVVNSVNNNGRYAQHQISRFLSGADPWLIAHAIVEGGRVVTFEKTEPNSRRPKIPDVGREFGVRCINIYDLLAELGAKF